MRTSLISDEIHCERMTKMAHVCFVITSICFVFFVVVHEKLHFLSGHEINQPSRMYTPSNKVISLLKKLNIFSSALERLSELAIRA